MPKVVLVMALVAVIIFDAHVVVEIASLPNSTVIPSPFGLLSIVGAVVLVMTTILLLARVSSDN